MKFKKFKRSRAEGFLERTWLGYLIGSTVWFLLNFFGADLTRKFFDIVSMIATLLTNIIKNIVVFPDTALDYIGITNTLLRVLVMIVVVIVGFGIALRIILFISDTKKRVLGKVSMVE